MLSAAVRYSYGIQRTLISESLIAFSRVAEALETGTSHISKPLLSEIRASLQTLWKHDLDCVRKGYYPEDLLKEGVSLRDLLTAVEGLADVPKVIQRKRKRNYKDLPKNVDLDSFPDYYLRNFHCQTDGWLSSRSARLWDAQANIYFFGATASLARTLIPHLAGALQNVPRPRIMDMGCGTGRFLKQLGRTFPKARLTAMDLSPYYLSKAQQNLSSHLNVSFILGNVTQMPIRDQTYDAITTIGLFHELPSEARFNALTEVKRVLKPGGVFVFTDPIQFEDQSPLEFLLCHLYKRFHEPYLKNYMHWNLKDAFHNVGLEIIKTEKHFLLKNVVAVKVA